MRRSVPAKPLAGQYAVSSLAPEEMQGFRKEILAIYQAAFSLPPYLETEASVQWFGDSFSRHLHRPGFRGCVAREEESGRVVGFAYGYHSRPGQWWYTFVAKELQPEAIQRWLGDAFEFVELAVLPAYQGQGLGGRLHDQLLHDAPHRTAVLSTAQAETSALHLYRKRGWQILLSNVIFPANPMAYYILGLDRSEKSRGE